MVPVAIAPGRERAIFKRDPLGNYQILFVESAFTNANLVRVSSTPSEKRLIAGEIIWAANSTDPCVPPSFFCLFFVGIGDRVLDFELVLFSSSSPQNGLNRRRLRYMRYVKHFKAAFSNMGQSDCPSKIALMKTTKKRRPPEDTWSMV